MDRLKRLPTSPLNPVNSLIIRAWETCPESIEHGTDELAVFLRTWHGPKDMVVIIAAALSRAIDALPMDTLEYLTKVVAEGGCSSTLSYAAWRHLLGPVRQRALEDPDFPAAEYTTTVLAMVGQLPDKRYNAHMKAFPSGVPASMLTHMMATWRRLAPGASNTTKEDIDLVDFWMSWPRKRKSLRWV